jgi:hypothetical protein
MAERDESQAPSDNDEGGSKKHAKPVKIEMAFDKAIEALLQVKPPDREGKQKEKGP